MSNEQGSDPKSGESAQGETPARGPMVIIRKAAPVAPASSGEVRPTAPQTAAPVAGEQADAPAAAVAAPAAAPAKKANGKREVAPASGALYDDVPEDQSFEELFESSVKDMPERRGARLGEKVTGKIFSLGKEVAFVTVGQGKSEAQISMRELMDDQGILRYGVGDTLEAHVVEIGAQGVMLSRALSKSNASMALLTEAAISGIPVEGLVLSVNKGGLEVAVGEVRAFCPVSQIDVRFVEQPERFVGENLKFRVTEVRGKNVVLSRRALLEEEQKAQAEVLRKTLEVGKVLKGRVVGVRDFGVFVDLGGLEGLIPVSELSHTRVGHPSEVVQPNEELEVEVIRMEAVEPNSPDKGKRKERITLSLRTRQADPFETALGEIKEGDRRKGKVVRLQPFGAFVELVPGVDGLIHISALSDRRIGHPRDVVKEGDEIWVAVDRIDVNEKRIGLRKITEEEAQQPYTPPAPRDGAPAGAEGAAAAPRPKPGQVVVGKVDRIESYGIFLAFPGGKGLVPGAETGTERGTDYRRVFSMGQELKAQILEIDASGKIKLSLTAAVRAEERADMEAYLKTQPKAAGGKGLGTFADLFANLKK